MIKPMDKGLNKCHTVVISDLHLSDAEPVMENNPLWKKFRQKQYFIDNDFKNFLDQIQAKIDGPCELVLNGDTFDFDSVMSLPDKNDIPYTEHERKRGLGTTEVKSNFKIQKILEDHNVWVDALASFVKNNIHNKVVFIIGNHDLELHWPKVQKSIISSMDLPEQLQDNIVFCEWFYISNRDTLIEHGNQYDPYNTCIDPINPTVRKGKHEIIRIPFGDMANKFLVNCMGLKNPHDDSAYVMELIGFIRFFFKYEFKIQPFLFWAWFTGAMRTQIVCTKEAWLPPLKDPLTLEAKIEHMAHKSQATVQQLRFSQGFHAHAAAFNPLSILRELWLDRALLLALILLVSFQFFSTTNLVIEVSFWWFVIPFLLCLPLFALYARGISSKVRIHAHKSEKKVFQVAKHLGCSRVVHGHTHHYVHKFNDEGIEFINTGSWTPLFRDPECTLPYGKMPFAWIKDEGEAKRRSNLYLFENSEFKQVPQTVELDEQVIVSDLINIV